MEEEIMEKGMLSLEKLLLNIRDNEIIRVIDSEYDLVYQGTEREIRYKIPDKLDYLISDIVLNKKDSIIQITIESNEA